MRNGHCCSNCQIDHQYIRSFDLLHSTVDVSPFIKENEILFFAMNSAKLEHFQDQLVNTHHRRGINQEIENESIRIGGNLIDFSWKTSAVPSGWIAREVQPPVLVITVGISEVMAGLSVMEYMK
ncbi:hypothetical protein CEXT_712661 [Caerostris extrusa]|uniref:Uncharacterized protein n=1 Tax=Caerostris extrusa TaxID=172846 RepID=A0AAV4QED9_CAEEX|nr:hypothetical protein CEXT_712661 [Caerostris extrusa]